MLFKEEREVLNTLLQEWYRAIKEFTKACDGIFKEKAKQYDRLSPVWSRIAFPHGFVQELTKKVDRLRQLLSVYDEGGIDCVEWIDVDEELIDIANYARMFGALATMLTSRKVEEAQDAQVLQE